MCHCVLQITQERPGECVTVFCRSHKRLKRMLFNRTKQDKTCKFLMKSSSSSSIQHEKQKQTINSLSLGQLDAGRLLDGKGHHLVCFSVFMLYIA